MFSKFFIDRPIFATVLSVLITLTGLIALIYLPIAQYPRITPPSVSVSIAYPGASAQVVADTVAAPIEQQVTGVPGMLYMSSQMGNDGTYSLSVTFDVDVNLNTALVMVQNRVALAMPLLPTPVQNQGITIRKKTPDILCMVNFLSAVDVTKQDGTVVTGIIKKDNEKELLLQDLNGAKITLNKNEVKISEPWYSDVYLSNYTLINLKDEMLRVEGVSDVNIMGERDYSIRVWLDPQKLAARSMTAIDVANAVRTQNIQAAPGQIGRPPISAHQTFQLPLDTLGRLHEPEQFANIIVKVGKNSLLRPATGVKAATPGAGLDDDSLQGSMTDPGLIGMDDSVAGSGSNDPSFGGADTSGGGTSRGVTGSATPGSGSDDPVLGMPSFMKTRKTNSAGKAKASAARTNQTTLSPSVSIVRLKDVADVQMGAQNYNMSCTFDGRPAVGLGVYQLPGTNALDVADRVRERMKELKKRFPEGMDYTIAYDTTPFIRESISEVFHTLRDAVLLVAFVVLLFLQDWRAMILPMIDIPVSLIGTFAVMAVMGYSLNNISLFGLVLAIGIVVDDAIVVLENIERQMARGYDTRTATIKAMEEITGPILAITLVLCAVFIPCAFISGITGRFFRQFAVTIAASTIISAINALTMTPSRALMVFKTKEGEMGGHEHQKEALPWWIFGLMGLVTLALGPHHLGEPMGWTPTESDEEGPDVPLWASWGWTALYFTPGMLAGLLLGWLIIGPVNAILGWAFRAFNRFFDVMTSIYGWVIGMGMRVSILVLLGYGGLLFLTYYLFEQAPRGFVPQQDMGRLIVSVQLPDSAGLARTQVAVEQVEKIIRTTPGVAHSIGLCGISFVEQANGSNFGSLFVILEPFAKRQQPQLRAESILADMRTRFAAEVKEARVVALGASPIPGLSVAGGFKVIVQDRGGLGLRTLQEQAEGLVRRVQASSYLITDATIHSLEVAGVPEKVLGPLGELHERALEKEAFLRELARLLDQQERQQYQEKILTLARQPQIGLTGVNTQFRSNTPQLYMDIDRAKVAAMGVPLEEVNQTLSIYLGSLYVNRFNEFGRQWQVTLQAERNIRSRIENINLLQVRNNNNQMVPLGTLVKVREITGPIFVKRYNLYTAAPVTGSLLPGVSSGDVIAKVNQVADEGLPRSMKIEWTELMFMQIREGSTTGIVFALAVVCVFLALSALYESWALPLAVILVVPLCVLSSLIGVLLTNISVNIFVQIGLVVLVGLACKNSILVVEFARDLHVQGRSVFDATLEASKLRLRPILMTSFAFILGVVPLCISSGAGAEMRRSLGIAVFSGMLGVTLFGIFMTPVFFAVIQGLGESRLFSGEMIQWMFSCLFGGLLGAFSGYLLAQLGHLHALLAPMIGAIAGILAVVAVRSVHKRLWSRTSQPRP